MGDLGNADYIVAQSKEAMGLTGERDALVVVDRGSNYIDCFPLMSRHNTDAHALDAAPATDGSPDPAGDGVLSSYDAFDPAVRAHSPAAGAPPPAAPTPRHAPPCSQRITGCVALDNVLFEG